MRTTDSFVIGGGDLQDYVLSPDGHTIYVAGADGYIRAYDTQTREETGAWRVGRDLGGIDVTPDGKTIIAVEDTQAFHAQGRSFDEVVTYQVYALDLGTGALAVHGQTVDEYYPDGFNDVATTSDGKAVISGDDQWGNLTIVDLATGAFTETNNSIYPSSLRASASHVHIAMVENGISDAPVDVFTSGHGITATHGNYDDNVQGYNYGVVAINDPGRFVAQGLGSQVNIYDLRLNYMFDLNSYKDLGLGTVQGLAFSTNGRMLYILDAGGHQVVAVNTVVWEPVARYGLGGADVTGNYYGNGLVASADGSYLAFEAADGVHVLDLTRGGATISGTAGADELAGGAGNDTYIVNDAGDVVTEDAGAGYDTVIASVTYTLATNVESLELAAGVHRGIGNALDNTLTGNDSANRLDGGLGGDGLYGGAGDDRLFGAGGGDVLDGGTGDDRMTGGAGSDRYIVDSVGDVVVEGAGPGTDTVEANVSYTLSANVEVLLLTGAGDLSGTGNGGDNRIVGTAGANVLSGMGGDDLLDAGGGGVDRMLGGLGADTFRFVLLDASGASYANADSIGDFNAAEGDLIDLSAIDADIFTAGDQAFTFIDRHAFTGHAGEVQWLRYSGDTYIQGDINGDKLIDFVIKLDGAMTPTATDFIL